MVGLNTYEAKAYDALILLGASTASRVAKKSGVPSGKIYPTLDSLQEKGFITITSGRPKTYRAISPEIALGMALASEKERLQSLTKTTEDIIAAYSKREPLKEEKPQDVVETYLGHSAGFTRSITLHNQAQRYWKTISHLTINKNHLDACSKAIKRGVKIQAITNVKETTLERVQQWKKRGVEVRFLEELPFRVSIYDDKGVIFRFSHEKSKQYISTHLRNVKLAVGMSSLFDSLWKAAHP